MNQRKDTYRAALRRRPETTPPTAPTAPAAPPPSAFALTQVTPLDTRYVKVTIELDTAPARDLSRWAGQQLSALVRAGEAVLRPSRQDRRADQDEHTV
ncbi:hypothetical protein [Streptomyces sp. IBSBF 3136]|uniref:hypothetical protein n=1 Tax=Streptomyces sp. IBSBF 3136 TaxID=2903524 RepID=UPI002FDC40F1